VSAPPSAGAAQRTSPATIPSVPEVKLTNPDKVLFPDDGITKAELRDYFVTVSEVMVRHGRDRAMKVWR